MLKISYAGLSDVGRVRTSNEDSMGLFPELNLYVVADGMGGHAAGEVASSMAVTTIREVFSLNGGGPTLSPVQRLLKAIQAANYKIYQTGKHTPALSGMGTTVVSVFLDQEAAYIGYVGDSRAYLIRQNEITQLTTDHSLINEYLKKGMLTPEEAEHHPLKHVLSRALGTAPEVEVDSLTLPLKSGDLLLVCTDGLSNTVTPLSILQILRRSGRESLEKVCQLLIEEANNHGGIDNTTVVILKCMDGP